MAYAAPGITHVRMRPPSLRYSDFTRHPLRVFETDGSFLFSTPEILRLSV